METMAAVLIASPTFTKSIGVITFWPLCIGRAGKSGHETQTVVAGTRKPSGSSRNMAYPNANIGNGHTSTSRGIPRSSFIPPIAEPARELPRPTRMIRALRLQFLGGQPRPVILRAGIEPKHHRLRARRAFDGHVSCHRFHPSLCRSGSRCSRGSATEAVWHRCPDSAVRLVVAVQKVCDPL